MFEVVVTFRPDFHEEALARFQTEAEARQAAQQFALENYAHVVRTRVRVVREAKTPG
jgi:hypothetical protein